MTLSVRERVIVAFQALMPTSLPNVPGTVTVYRARRQEIPEGKLQAGAALNLVIAGSPAPEQFNAGVSRNFVTITVEGQVAAGDDATLDQYLSDLRAAIMGAVEANPTLGGLAVNSTVANEDQLAADADGVGAIGAVLASWQIEFWTKPGDQYALAP